MEQTRALASLAMIARSLCHGQSRGADGAERGRDEGMTATRSGETEEEEEKGRRQQRLKARQRQSQSKSHDEVEKRRQDCTLCKTPATREYKAVSAARTATSCQFSCFCSWFWRDDGWKAIENDGQVNGSTNHRKQPSFWPLAYSVFVLSSLVRPAVLPHQQQTQSNNICTEYIRRPSHFDPGSSPASILSVNTRCHTTKAQERQDTTAMLGCWDGTIRKTKRSCMEFDKVSTAHASSIYPVLDVTLVKTARQHARCVRTLTVASCCSRH